MTPEVLQMIAQFMNRVQLQATEIDAYQTCIQSLQEAYNEATNPSTTDPVPSDSPDEPS